MTEINAFEIARVRCVAARDDLVKYREVAKTSEDMPSQEAYDLAIDEVDKLVYAMRRFAEGSTNLARWIERAGV